MQKKSESCVGSLKEIEANFGFKKINLKWKHDFGFFRLIQAKERTCKVKNRIFIFFLDVIMKVSNIILATNYPSLDRTRRNSKFKLGFWDV
jgi:hypothetical protein